MVLTDSIFGKKVYFRITRIKVVDEFGDETDKSLDCVTDKDSIIFKYVNKDNLQSFDFYKIPSDSNKSYVLHIEYYPRGPPFW